MYMFKLTICLELFFFANNLFLFKVDILYDACEGTRKIFKSVVVDLSWRQILQLQSSYPTLNIFKNILDYWITHKNIPVI